MQSRLGDGSKLSARGSEGTPAPWGVTQMSVQRSIFKITKPASFLDAMNVVKGVSLSLRCEITIQIFATLNTCPKHKNKAERQHQR